MHTAKAQLPLLSREELWALAERACASHHLNRSARLKELLHFLCRRAWDEGAEEIKEHEIGVAVFERDPQFDSSQDTLVRVQASQLRKRLERYFAEEGVEEPVILEIPRGSYVPLVHGRETEKPTEVLPPLPPSKSTDHRLVWGLSALCLILAATSLTLWLRPSNAPTTGRSVRLFWDNFSGNGRQNYIVLADSAIAAIQDALGHPIGLDEYLRRSYIKDLSEARVSPEYRDLVGYLMGRRYTSLADVFVVRQIEQARLLEPTRTSVVYARDHNVRAFQTGNNILIGSQRAVPWVHLFNDMMDFHVSDRPADFHLQLDASNAKRRVENRRPLKDEPVVFESDTRSPEGDEGYSIIAYLPNLSRNGHTIVLGGTDMSGTEAAGMVLTTETFLEELLRRLPRQPDGSLPHFEVLLKTKQVESTNRGYQIVALHLH
ncbi:MAG: hypothetical protein JST93_11005 [Acidobacteria bacterium]|nr:hypothetical protein [Acidobacteriota bacterium]